MPRKSAAELSVIPGGTRSDRLRPPASLGAAEREIFIATIAACDPAHFTRNDLPLLCRWCEQNAMAEQAALELRNYGAVIGGRPSPWLAVSEKANRAVVALAMRLRLSPQARQPNNPSRVGAGRAKTSSAYDELGFGDE